MKGNTIVKRSGESGLKDVKIGKLGITPSLKPSSIIPFLPFIRLSMIFKQKLGLSTPCMYLLFMVYECNIIGSEATVSKLSDMLYDSHNGYRSIRYRLITLISNNMVYKVDNKYYLTELSITAISNIQV